MRTTKTGSVTTLLGLLALAPLGTASAESMSIATLPPGSIFHTMGSVIAKVAAEKGRMRLLVLPFGGTPAALAAVNSGDAEFAIIEASSPILASQGLQEYKGRAQRNIRMVLRLRSVPVGIFVRNDSKIQSIADLKGTRLSTGWRD